MIVKIKEKKALLCFSTKRSLFLGGQKAPLNTYDQKSWCRERFRGKLYLEVNAYQIKIQNLNELENELCLHFIATLIAAVLDKKISFEHDMG